MPCASSAFWDARVAIASGFIKYMDISIQTTKRYSINNLTGSEMLVLLFGLRNYMEPPIQSGYQQIAKDLERQLAAHRDVGMW